MTPSHVFSCKAFLRANIVLKRPFFRRTSLGRALFWYKVFLAIEHMRSCHMYEIDVDQTGDIMSLWMLLAVKL